MDDAMEVDMPSTSRTVHVMHTPRTRGKQRFSLSVSSTSAEDTENVDTLEELLHKTWTIFGVSTLFNFHRDEVHLKRYAKGLREEVASSLAQEDVAYSTEFSVMENVTHRPSPKDPPPIKIEVYAEKSNDQESSKKCIYTGVILSWRTTKDELPISNSIRLPLLLCRGTKGAITAVHNVLKRMCDCMIIALPMQEDDLIWLLSIIITPIDKELPQSMDEIQMVYRVPGLSDSITIKFQILDLIKIWTVIIEDENDEASGEISFSIEHIEKFREVLYAQILQSSNLQLGLCTLCRISLPALTIMGNRMKVMNTDAMNRVLLYLNEKALDTLHT